MGATFDWKKKASAAALRGIPGVWGGICYPKQRKVYSELTYGNDVGYLPDGTPMNKAGNECNHPERQKPDTHTNGSPLLPPFKGFINDVGYLPDGTDMKLAGNSY